MQLKRLLLGVWIMFLPLSAVEPIPFVNPHPLSISHMNPVMDGVEERIDVMISQTSFYEEGENRFDGVVFSREIDYEATELVIFGKKRFGKYFVSVNGGVTYNSAGIMDNLIVFVHDRSGSTGGIWKERREAPRNRYHFSVKDENGVEQINFDTRWRYRFDFFVGREMAGAWYLRLGTKAPVERELWDFSPIESEYSLTLQKYLEAGELSLIADVSAIRLSEDRFGLPLKEYRATGNLNLTYGKKYYIQFNYAESPYKKTEDQYIDSSGLVYTFGYRAKTWYIGFMEDISEYSAPDVAVMVGWEF